MELELFVEVFGTIIGGAVLVFILFLIQDKIFGAADISGPWTFVTETEDTSYNPYRGMCLTYLALVWAEGNVVRGSAEKVQERHGNVSHEYVGEKRSLVVIRGHIYRRLFMSDYVVLHLEEKGSKRTSSSIQKLTIKNGGMTGRFFSTAANSSGSASWEKGADSHHFEA